MSLPTLFLITLPWLNPFTFGPQPATVPVLFSWACFVLLGMLLSNAAATTLYRKQMDGVIAEAWLAAAVISSCLALIQYAGASAILSPWLNITNPGEAYANLRQRNQFATLTNIGLAALLWCGLRMNTSDSSGAPRSLGYLPVYGAASLLACGTAASSSRTGLLQLIAMVALVLAWRRFWPREGAHLAVRLLIIAVVSYGLASVLLPVLAGLDVESAGIVGRLRERSPACGSRITLWRNVLDLIAQKPLLGWGWGELDYAHFTAVYRGPRFCEILGNAHNLPLHLAVELGVPIAAAFCMACAWILMRAKPWAEAKPTRQMAWAILALIGLHSLLEYPLWYGPFQMATLLSIYLLRPPPKPMFQEARRPKSHGLWGLLVGLVMLVGLAYTAWDYWRISQIYLPASQRATAYRENTLEKIKGSWLFQDQVKFAELSITPLSQQNAQHIHNLAKEMLHFSPEAMVVEKVIDSARLLGDEDVVRFYSVRYQAAFPEAFAAWNKKRD